ncbi:MAG: hypothetical protein GTN78_08215 [Gemmatimonadales bacterium]|nr:hypothetical protein [Gemmatimonadales bacterium]
MFAENQQARGYVLASEGPRHCLGSARCERRAPDSRDLTFRHALDVDESGEHVVFDSTTGSLWVSQNQGDSWTDVSANLPPIYCARFDK